MLRERRVLCSPRALFSPLRTSDLREKKKIRTTLILALSGTLGVGNITGVAASLILGGAGSVFWMLLSTPFAIALKYAESSISISRGNGEGIPGVLKNTLGNRTGKHLSHLYLFLFLMLALVLGGALQGNAIFENTLIYFRLDRKMLSIFLTLAVAFAVLGKTEKILKILSFSLPFATIIYIMLCLCVLLSNIEQFPYLFHRILNEAFEGVRPTVAGVVGAFTSHAAREGFSAGVLSNEAGAGTSAFAHEGGESFRRAGAIGALEVIFDTALLCTLSALTFLIGSSTDGAGNAAEVIERTFLPVLGRSYVLPLLISLSLLAISSNLCYAVYVRRTLSHAHRERWIFPFTLLFLLATGLGGMLSSTLLVTLSHYLLFALCILTAIAVFASFLGQDNKKGHLSNGDNPKD